MPLEIERKFLLKNTPLNLQPDKVLQIEQYYCSSKKEPSFRIRESLSLLEKNSKEVYTKTVKKRLSSGVYEEYEIEITKKEFKKYTKHARSKIEKVRYVKNVGKLKWEIDLYLNVRLVTAEIELPHIDYPIKFPNFILENLIMEVTDINVFSNQSLSSSTFLKP